MYCNHGCNLCHFNAVLCTLVAVCECCGNRTWQWLGLMVVNLQHCCVPRLPYSFWPITGASRTRGRSHCHGLTKLPSDGYRCPFFFLSLSFLLFNFFLLLSERIWRVVRWRNHVHISVSCSVYLLHCWKQMFLSSITCSFKRAVWRDTCSCHSWCLAYASLS